MSKACWQLEELGEDGLVARLTRPASGAELAAELLPSKAVVARAFARGQLRRTGAVVSRTTSLEAGDLVTLSFWRERGAETPPGPRSPGSDEPTVVYRDPLMMAVDKPAGLLVHGDGTGALTLTGLVGELLSRQGSAAEPQVVQRLDVETTGLVLFSLTQEFQPALDAQVAGHEMRKRYLAAVEGRLHGATGGWLELRDPIGRDRHDARRMRVARSGKPALTRVRELAHAGGRTLLLVELGSGRRHQIRVHLAHAGCPIVGDALYGRPRSGEPLMLHAWEEELDHPLTGRRVLLRTAVPKRLARLFPGADLSER